MEISLTFDTDWVDELAIIYVVNLLNKYDQNATFFATNKYEIFSDNGFTHEIGLHPNFNNLLNKGEKSFKEIIDEIHSIYPSAKGFRSHSLTTSSHILAYFKELGFAYDSNIFHPKNISGYHDHSGLYRFVHNYVDLGHLIEERELKIDNMNLSKSNLNILDFHPIHIYLNTPSVEYYNKYKTHTNSKHLSDFINKYDFGIGDLFIELLKYMRKNNIKSNSLIKNYENLRRINKVI